MKYEFFKKLCCPFDKNELELEIFKEDKDEIKEALITCTDCQRYYPVIFGIPIMSPDEYRQPELEAPILNRWGYQISDKKPQQLLHLK